MQIHNIMVLIFITCAVIKGTSFRERNVHFAKGTFISRKEDFFLRKEDIISNLNG